MQPAKTESSRTEIETVDCEERARVALKAATQRVGGSWEAIAANWARALNDLRTLRMRGLDRTDFAHVEMCVAGVVADLFAGVTDITHIRRLRSQADREDDRLTDLRSIDGAHVVSNKELAAAYRRTAAVHLAAACAYEQADRDERRDANRNLARLRETGRAS